MAEANFKRQIVLEKEGNEILVLKSKVAYCTIGSVNCDVTLSQIEFVNEMYSPAHLTVKATLVRSDNQGPQNGQKTSSLPSYQSIVDFFLLAQASVMVPVMDPNEKKIVLVLAESNFYVHEVRPTYVDNGEKVILYLDIFSADKLLTLDKYSKSYVHKSLFGDIISKEVNDFKAGDIKISTQDSSSLLKYKKSPNDTEKTVELIHPYLVQYNEPFYDFLVRTANRMGEFLYFADGKLTLGAKVETDATKIKTIGNYASFSVESRNNSVRPTRGISRKYTGTKYAESCNDTTPRYTQPTSNDDYLLSYEKDGFDSWMSEYKPGWRFLPLAFSTWFNTPTLGALIAKVLIDQGKDATFSKLNADAVNKKYNENTFDKALPSSKSADGKNVVVTGTYRKSDDYIDDWYVNVNADFYNKIDECEKMMSSRTVTITLNGDDTENYQVGQIAKVSNISYVITQVKYSEIYDGLNMAYEHVLQVLPLLNVSIENGKHEATLKLTDGLASKPTTGTNIDICCPMPLPEERRVRKASPQTAWVSDNEDPKFLGRVRIYYSWDQPGTASPWLRQAEPAAGHGGGFSFRLYKEDEVMIGYENDNIEQPFVIGALYHGKDEKDNSFGPPTGRNKKSAYTHQFSNRSGHKMIMTELKNNWAFLAGVLPATTMFKGPIMNWDDVNENGTDLAGGFQFTDKYGMYNVQMSTDERLISIASPMGDIKLSAFTGISISAPRGDISISGKNVTIKAANKLTLESGTNAKNTDYLKTKHDIGLGYAIGHAVTDGALNWISSMIDLKLLRHATECIIPPVDGTLQIKSNRYLLLEAGDGKTTIPQIGYDDGVPVGEKDPISYNKFYGGNGTAVKIRQHIKLLDAMVTELLIDYVTVLQAVLRARREYRIKYQDLGEHLKANVKPDENNNTAAFDAIKSIIKKKKFESKVISNDNHSLDGQDEYAALVGSASSYWSSIKALVNFIETRSDKGWAITRKIRYSQDGDLGAAFDKAKNEILSIFSRAFIRDITVQNIGDTVKALLDLQTQEPKPIARVLGKYLIELRKNKIIEERVSGQAGEAEGNEARPAPLTENITAETNMATFVDRLFFCETSGSYLKKALINLGETQKKNIDFWSALTEKGKWGYDRAKFGRILFSDQGKKTCYINQNNNFDFATNPDIQEIRDEVLKICGIERQNNAQNLAIDNNI